MARGLTAHGFSERFSKFSFPAPIAQRSRPLSLFAGVYPPWRAIRHYAPVPAIPSQLRHPKNSAPLRLCVPRQPRLRVQPPSASFSPKQPTQESCPSCRRSAVADQSCSFTFFAGFRSISAPSPLKPQVEDLAVAGLRSQAFPHSASPHSAGRSLGRHPAGRLEGRVVARGSPPCGSR
jgi:hypothetical protein